METSDGIKLIVIVGVYLILILIGFLFHFRGKLKMPPFNLLKEGKISRVNLLKFELILLAAVTLTVVLVLRWPWQVFVGTFIVGAIGAVSYYLLSFVYPFKNIYK
jgi:hypothetical protein